MLKNLKNLKNLRHLIRIARTLARHDALFPLELLQMPSISFIAKLARRKSDLPQGERLANAFTELGPTFIKLGQALSVRSDLIGVEIARDLAVLRDKLPPFDIKVSRETVEKELEDSIDNIFEEFAEEPVAAASIAQVHFAKLKNGEDVAVKILRPDIESKIRKDMKLFRWIAEIIAKRNPYYAKRMKPMEVVDEFERIIALELDFRMEAASASLLRENFAEWDSFYVPKIYWKHTTSRVLVIEKVNGLKIDDREAILKSGFDPAKILEEASKSLFKQVFNDGFFHADLHPGNVFINHRGQIVPIDFGIMGRVDVKSRIYIADILAGFLTRDYRKVAKAHFDAGYVPRTKSIDDFALACRAVGEPIMDLPINEISVAKLLGQMFKVAEDFEMEAQPHLLLLQKTMMMAEGVGRSLNPEVNMWKLAEPLVREWMVSNLGVKAKLHDTAQNAMDIFKRIPDIVKKLDKFLDETH